MQILSFSLIPRIGCYRHQELFAPALSHCILGTADTRLKGLEPQSSPNRQSRSAPGIHPGQGPFTQIPTGPGKDKADTFMVGLAISHHPAAAWETARQSLGPHPAEGPRFSGLAPCFYGDPGHTDQPGDCPHSETPPAPRSEFLWLLLWSFVTAVVFSVRRNGKRVGLEVCSNVDLSGRRMASSPPRPACSL